MAAIDPALMEAAPTWRECTKCFRVDLLENFPSHKQRRYGKARNCKTCKSEAGKSWYKENRDKANQASRAWYKENSDSVRVKNLKKFGITAEDYDRMLISQNGVCKICRLPETQVDRRTGGVRRLAVDHCHSTDKVRGLLCCGCNTGIGNLGDSAERLRAAADYVEKFS